MILKIFLLCVITSALALGNKLDSPSKRFLASLPKSDKSDYLVFALGKGYSTFNSNNRNKTVNFLFSRSLNNYPKTIEKFERLEVPENFENNLYSYTKETFSLSPRNIRSLIQSRKICFNRRKCISIDDIGNMCCPF